MRIVRYFHLFKILFGFNLKTVLEFRGEVFFWSLYNFLWLGFGMLGVELVFGKVETIAGWTKNEVMLLLLVSNVFHDLFWTFIFNNLGNFSYFIRAGRLDNLLLLPVDLRFLLSLRQQGFDHYGRLLLESYFIYHYLYLLRGEIVLKNLLLFLFLFAAGILIFYSLYFSVAVLNIWFVNLHNLVDVFSDVKELGSQPVYIFKGKLFYFFSFFLPVGYIATFPVEALLGKVGLEKILLAPILAALAFIFSQRFFRFALRFYTSASN